MTVNNIYSEICIIRLLLFFTPQPSSLNKHDILDMLNFLILIYLSITDYLLKYCNRNFYKRTLPFP